MEGRDSGQKTELISGDGVFNEAGVANFAKSVKLDACGVSYAVVAIMGPQSSGKSTLLNHLFHTNFKEMDANIERKQTTKGIWIAKAPNIEPLTLVLDLEGTDGAERGEDDKAFEKQSAIFALAVADIVLINMWCIELGREQGANRPLLKTIFEVTMRTFSSPRKTTLLFVLRDKPKRILFEDLKNRLMKDIQKIWEIVPKTNDSSLSDFYNVEVIALSNYEYQEEQFKEEVAELRNRFSNSTSCGGIAGDRRGAVPGSRFHSNAKNVWDASTVRKELVPDIENRTASIRSLTLVEDQCRVRIVSELGRGMGELLGMVGGRYIQWSDFRSLLRLQIEAAEKELHAAVAAIGMDQKIVGQKVHDIEQFARNLVETKLRNSAPGALNFMLRRHLQPASEEKKLECLKLLSTIAVLRFEEEYEGVERVLVSGLIDEDQESKAFLDSTKWKEVPPEMTLITPAACKDIWKAYANTCSHNRFKKIASTTLTVSLALLGIPRFGMNFFHDDDPDSVPNDDPDFVDHVADSAGDALHSVGDALKSVGDFALQMF